MSRTRQELLLFVVLGLVCTLAADFARDVFFQGARSADAADETTRPLEGITADLPAPAPIEAPSGPAPEAEELLPLLREFRPRMQEASGKAVADARPAPRFRVTRPEREPVEMPDALRALREQLRRGAQTQIHVAAAVRPAEGVPVVWIQG